MHRSLFVLILAACSHASEAPPPSPTGSASVVVTPVLADAASPLATCVVRDNVDQATITPAAVDFCAGEGASRSCWHVDIATKHVEGRSVTAKHDDPMPAQTDMLGSNGTLTLCTAAKKCSTVTPAIKVGSTDQLGTNADATILARLPELGSLELYDTATWKRLAKITPWKTPMGAAISAWTFAGPNIIVWENFTPVSSKPRIFTLAGKLVAEVGDRDFGVNVEDSWAAEGTTRLFKQLDGTKLLAVDVASGKLLKTYDLAPLALATNDTLVMPSGEASSADTIVYLATAGVVGIIDRASGKVDVVSPPVCH